MHFKNEQEADSFKISANMPYIMLQKFLNVLVKLRKTFSYTSFYFIAHAHRGQEFFALCILYDHCFRNILCIVLNKFYCILFRR